MTIIKGSLSGSNLFYFSLENPVMIKATEILRLNIKNFYFSPFIMLTGTVIQAEGILTHIIDSQITGGVFYAKSYFYLSQHTLNTLLMKNISFNGTVILDNSALISTSTDVNKNSFKMVEDSFDDTLGEAIYAETKPLIIYNSTFTNIAIEFNCSLIYSSSPETVIEQNTFSQLSARNSSLLVLGNYIFSTGQSLWTDDFGELMWSNVVSFVQAENSVFKDYPEFHEIFNNSRTTISSFDSVNNVFFILVQENTFDTFKATDTNYLITITDFEEIFGTVAASNNQFINFASVDGTIMSIFSHTEFSRGTYTGNSLANGNLTGFFFAFFASETPFVNISVSLNTLSSCYNSGFYSINSPSCTQITVKDSIATDLEISGTFIDINCAYIEDTMILQNLTFTNIYQTLTARQLLSSTNFISIVNSEAVDTSLILIQECYFYNLTMINTKSSSKLLYSSSFLYITAFVSELRFENITFDTFLASPKGGVILASTMTVTFSNSAIRNVGFGSTNGAIIVLSEATSIENCIFESNYGVDPNGAGLFGFIHIDPLDESGSSSSNMGLEIVIQNSTFHNNTTPYGSIMYIQDSSIQLSLYEVQVINNQVTDSGGLINLFGLSSSTISIENSNFQQTEGYMTIYPQLRVFFLENTGSDVSITFTNSSVLSKGKAYGVLISVESYEEVALTFDQVFFYAESLTYDDGFEEIPQFGFLEADNFEAIITNFQANNVSLDQTPLFTINCNTLGKQFYNWSLALEDSNFDSLDLSESIFLINSDENLIAPLDDLTLRISNTTFTNISWSISSADSAAGGIIRSSTSLIGRTTPSMNFAIVLENSSFSQLSGTITSLLFSSVESMYDSVMMINDCTFISLKTNGMGALINPTITQLPSFNIQYNPSISRNFSYNIASSVFLDIQGTSGCILYWESNLRGLSMTFQDNNITNVVCAQEGGILYMSYHTISTNITISENHRLLANTESTVGSVTMTGNRLTAVTAADGGIIYEATIDGTMEIILNSNVFQSINATSRGGVLFISQPFLSVINNTFDQVSAKYAGNLVFALSGDVNLSELSAKNNTVIPNSTDLFSYQPTNLKVRFMSLINGSTLQLENENVIPYSPTVTGLTSYSLSQYQIDLTLMYEGRQGSQVIMDGSSIPQITLVFTTQRDDSSLKYSGSNCSNSMCSVFASNIILKGLAEDLVTVNATYTSNLYTITQQFDIRLRSCISGEINVTSSLECTYCQMGTYSFTPNDTSCKECPNGAICFGGTNISISQGYYWSHASQTELLVVNCDDNGTRCLGGYDSACEKTFTGPVCLQCNQARGYISAGKVTECSMCYEKAKLIPIAIFLLLASIGYQIVMIMVTYKENKSTHEEYQIRKGVTGVVKPGQFMVIFSKFCQITSVLPGIDGGLMGSFLGISNTVGNSNTQVMFSIQCLYSLVAQDKLKGLQFQILVYILSPLVKVLFVILIELIRNLCCRDKRGQGRRKSLIRIGSVAVVLILLEQPGIVGILCKYLNCSKLDPNVDEYYVKFYSDVQCYTNKYNLFAWVFVLPALIFWAFILPVSIFGILYKNRMRLYESEAIRIVLGNFYNSHSKKTYYWGVVILFFKLNLFILNSVMAASDIFKGVIFMLIIHIYYHLLRRNLPYTNTRLILAEKCCCAAYMSMLTLMFLKESTDNYGLQIVCEVFICISMIVAGAYMLSNTGILFATKFSLFIKLIKDKKKQRAIFEETMKSLQEYHRENIRSQGVDSKNQRRGALSVDLPLRLRDTESYERELEMTKKRGMNSKKTPQIWTSMKSLFTGGSISENVDSRFKIDTSRRLSGTQLELTSSLSDFPFKSPNGRDSIKERDESSLMKRSMRVFEEGGVNLEDHVVSAEEINLECENRMIESHHNSIDLARAPPRFLLDHLRSATPTKIKRSRFHSIDRDSENGDETQTGSPLKKNLFKRN